MIGSRFVSGPAALRACRWLMMAFAVVVLGSMAGGTARAALPPDIAVVVRHAPQVNGRIEGSLQQNLGEAVTLNSGAVITQEFVVPGTPAVFVDPAGSIGLTIQEGGSAAPSGYVCELFYDRSFCRIELVEVYGIEPDWDRVS